MKSVRSLKVGEGSQPSVFRGLPDSAIALAERLLSAKSPGEAGSDRVIGGKRIECALE